MWLDRAEQEISNRAVSPIEGLSFRRGEALLALRRVPEAEAAFRTEVVHFPQNVEAWSRLAVVVAAQGRRDEARSILSDALRVNPNDRMRELAREALEVSGDRDGLRLLGER